jgi:nitrogen fixation-related uncharacterized protein
MVGETMPMLIVGALLALVVGLSVYLWYVTPEPQELAKK